jgi:hypothetical protein
MSSGEDGRCLMDIRHELEMEAVDNQWLELQTQLAG